MTASSPRLREFGARLKALRLAYGVAIGRPNLSATKFAAEIGVQFATYSRWERGEMEMPHEKLIALRVLTGVSLDRLVANLPPGRDEIVVERRGEPAPITFGMRLRWARELMAPEMATAAEVMETPLEVWAQYENDEIEPPLIKVREFVHRFSVTLDYLYTGSMKGIPRIVKRALLRRHPELGRVAGNGTQVDFGKTLQLKELPPQSTIHAKKAH